MNPNFLRPIVLYLATALGHSSCARAATPTLALTPIIVQC